MMASARRQPPPQSAALPTRSRALLEFAIRGDLRFLSHHDTMRLLSRGMLRARWPLAYTQGFNPQPRLGLPLPRSVGIASECDVALVDLATPEVDSAALHTGLVATLPEGIAALRTLAPVARRTLHARRAEYRVSLPDLDAQRVRQAAETFLQQAACVVQRSVAPGKPPRQVEIRRFVDMLELEHDELRIGLIMDQQGAARPTEVLAALGLDALRQPRPIRRVHITWDIELSVLEAGTLENDIGKENCEEDSEDGAQGDAD